MRPANPFIREDSRANSAELPWAGPSPHQRLRAGGFPLRTPGPPPTGDSALDVVTKAVHALEAMDVRRRQAEAEALKAIAAAEHRAEVAEARASTIEGRLFATEARAAEAEEALRSRGGSPALHGNR